MRKNIEGIHFIITGGTIDSYYDGAKDTVVTGKHSVVPSFIRSLKIKSPMKFTEVCMKDSRSLTEKNLQKILATVKKSGYRKIIVTHGTYTMPDTARLLHARFRKSGRVIVLTGSLIPIKGFAPSDGTFNLGYALGKIDGLRPGVYVAMHARIFSPGEVLKILYSGTFSSIFGEDEKNLV